MISSLAFLTSYLVPEKGIPVRLELLGDDAENSCTNAYPSAVAIRIEKREIEGLVLREIRFRGAACRSLGLQNSLSLFM